MNILNILDIVKIVDNMNNIDITDIANVLNIIDVADIVSWHEMGIWKAEFLCLLMVWVSSDRINLDFESSDAKTYFHIHYFCNFFSTDKI